MAEESTPGDGSEEAGAGGDQSGADGEEEDIGRRAARLAEAATHDSVTISGLLGTVADGGYLYDGPPLDHLEEGEQPHFQFHNDVKGVSTGSRFGGTKPDPEGGTVVLVTDQRILALVGREDGDITFSVPLADVRGGEYATARTKGRLTARTDETQYHFWVHRTVSTEALAAVVDFIREHADNLDSEQ